MRDSLNIIRYLSFEINRNCPNAHKHPRCPSGNAERYRYNRSRQVLTLPTILEFWRWAKTKGFRGLVMFHMYNEPMLVPEFIYDIRDAMLREDPHQGFQLTTSMHEVIAEDFDIVKISDYRKGGNNQLDNRVATAYGEGKPYSEMPSHGGCGRGLGWEMPIDFYGNWCLCCNDWRCEEAIGNIFSDPWDVLLTIWNIRRKLIRWHDVVSYMQMPRMCRACLQKNPDLSKRGGI